MNHLSQKYLLYLRYPKYLSYLMYHLNLRF